MASDDQHSTKLPAVSLSARFPAPRLIEEAGAKAKKRFFEFFTATIRNQNTRQAYVRALSDFFAWCDDHDFDLLNIEPIVVAAYIEYLGTIYASPTVKQHLAAIRMCFDWLVVGQILPTNPASAVRGPKHVVKRGKTPVLSATEARLLLDSIECSTVVGLRDRALIGLMIFSFARVSAVLGMNIEDYYRLGKRSYIRLHEKGGKFHEVPAHHKAEEFLDAYIATAEIESDASGPLFRTAAGKTGEITINRMSRQDAARMVKRRSLQAGLSDRISCHTFRATGITAYLENGGTIENAQAIAAHESPRTTKLYDRTGDELTLDEIERILI